MKPFKNGYKITQLFGNNPTYYSQWGFKAHEGIDLIPTDSDWNTHSMEDGVCSNHCLWELNQCLRVL